MRLEKTISETLEVWRKFDYPALVPGYQISSERRLRRDGVVLDSRPDGLYIVDTIYDKPLMLYIESSWWLYFPELIKRPKNRREKRERERLLEEMMEESL